MLAAGRVGLWAAGMVDGLFVLEKGNWRAVSLPRQQITFRLPGVEALFVDPAGSVWIALCDQITPTRDPDTRLRRHVFRSQGSGRTWEGRLVTSSEVVRIGMTAAGGAAVTGGDSVQHESRGAWRTRSQVHARDMVVTPDRVVVAEPSALFESRGTDPRFHRLPRSYRIPNGLFAVVGDGGLYRLPLR